MIQVKVSWWRVQLRTVAATFHRQEAKIHIWEVLKFIPLKFKLHVKYTLKLAVIKRRKTMHISTITNLISKGKDVIFFIKKNDNHIWRKFRKKKKRIETYIFLYFNSESMRISNKVFYYNKSNITCQQDKISWLSNFRKSYLILSFAYIYKYSYVNERQMIWLQLQ